MSTKIYDAYKFPKKLSVDELTRIVLAQKPELEKEAQKMFFINIIKKFVYEYDKMILLQKKCFERQINEISTRTNANPKELKISVYKAFMSGDDFSAVDALCRIEFLYSYYARHDTFLFDYRAELCVIPCDRKMLAMVFGHYALRQKMVALLNLEDYHYQNQTDRPDDISSREWNTRKKVWDKAIGPDYIPINHGFSFKLVDPNDLGLGGLRMYEHKYNQTIITKELIDAAIPDIPDRARNIVDYMDYPNPVASSDELENRIDISSDEFKNWQSEKCQEVSEKLKDVNVHEVLYNVFRL